MPKPFLTEQYPSTKASNTIGTGNAELTRCDAIIVFIAFEESYSSKRKTCNRRTNCSTKNNNLAEPEPIKKKADGEAFEATKLNRKNKPKNSPDIDKWVKKGGKVEELPDGTWKYTDWGR